MAIVPPQPAKYDILDEISLVRDRSGWWRFGADYGILVQYGTVLTWYGADLMRRGEDFTQCSTEMYSPQQLLPSTCGRPVWGT